MDNLLNEATLLSGSLIPIVLIFVQLIKGSDTSPKLLPWIAIGLGVALGLTVGIALNASLLVYGLAGLLAGAGASGVYDAGKSIKGDN